MSRGLVTILYRSFIPFSFSTKTPEGISSFGFNSCHIVMVVLNASCSIVPNVLNASCSIVSNHPQDDHTKD